MLKCLPINFTKILVTTLIYSSRNEQETFRENLKPNARSFVKMPLQSVSEAICCGKAELCVKKFLKLLFRY